MDVRRYHVIKGLTEHLAQGRNAFALRSPCKCRLQVPVLSRTQGLQEGASAFWTGRARDSPPRWLAPPLNLYVLSGKSGSNAEGQISSLGRLLRLYAPRPEGVSLRTQQEEGPPA